MVFADVQRSHILPPLRVYESSDSDYVMLDSLLPLERLKEMLSESSTHATEFKDVLSSIYGSDLISRVETSGLMDKWTLRLERRHCLEALAAVGHFVTLDDLNAMWSKLRQLSADHPIRRFLNIDPSDLNGTDRVEELPSLTFQKLIRLIRNPLALLEPENKKTLWQEISEFPKTTEKRLMAYTRYEDTVEQMYSCADRTKLEFLFAPHELLAKFVAYAKPNNLQNGMIVPVFCSGEIVYYKTEAHLHDSGLHAYLFTPVNPNCDHPAQLVFRGTNGMKSAARDLDVSGVGKLVFDKNRSNLLKMIEAFAARSEGPVNLEVCGHSLGGADAQRAIISVTNEIAKGPETLLGKKIKTLKLFAYCSPKLDAAAVKGWKQSVQMLANHPSPPLIELNFAEHENDLVTRAGDSNIGSANCNFIEANYLLVKSRSGIEKTGVHHTSPFFQKGSFDYQTDERTFLLFQDREFNKIMHEIDVLKEKQIKLGKEGEWSLIFNSSEALNPDEIERVNQAEILAAKLEKEKAEIAASQIGAAHHSWLVWGASVAVQPLKLLAGFIVSAF